MVTRTLTIILVSLALAAGVAAAHTGGRYWTVADMEGNLERGAVYAAICEGRGIPRRRNLPRLLWQYKHFRCVINSLVGGRRRSTCATVHRLRTGKFVLTGSRPAGSRCL